MPAIKAFSFEPMLCESAGQPPEGPHWRYELKLDGFRAIGHKSSRSSRLWSRNGKDFARRFPAVVKALDELPGDTVIDGEIVALDETGRPSFNLLLGFGGEAAGIVLYAFDLLMLRGDDVRPWPLEERRQQLSKIIQRLPSAAIRYSETFNVPVQELSRAVKEQRLEGIIAKRAGSRYRSGERCED